MDYELIKERRKTLSIHVSAEGVIVKAPIYATSSEINQFVKMKEGWILKKLDELRERKERTSHLINNELFFYLGENYKLIPRNQPMAVFFDDAFYVKEDLWPLRKDLVKRWLFRRAQEYLPKRTYEWAEKCSLYPKKVKISKAVSRWGSCSTKKSINLSWRLIMAPPSSVDAVIVHELAHLRHLNHSRHFYSLVESCLPSYKKDEKWLDEFGVWIKF